MLAFMIEICMYSMIIQNSGRLLGVGMTLTIEQQDLDY